MTKSIFFLVLAFCTMSCGTNDPVSAVIAAETTAFSVTSSGMTAYLVNGVNNPALTLKRGSIYTFNVNAPGHPFYIKTVQSSGTGNVYSSGVVGNGSTSGLISFDVPLNAPATLFYNCSLHAAMSGAINVVD